MSAGGDFAQALAQLDWERLEALSAPGMVVTIMGDWIHGGTIDLAQLRRLTRRGAAGRPPLSLGGRVRHVVERGGRVAAEIAGAPDYAMIATMADDRAVQVGLYFDVLAYEEAAAPPCRSDTGDGA